MRKLLTMVILLLVVQLSISITYAKAFNDITSKINIDDDVKFYIKALFSTEQMVPHMVLMMTKVNYER